MSRLRQTILLYLLPWLLLWGIYAWGYDPERGELVKPGQIAEFSPFLGALDRSIGAFGPIASNPLDHLDIPSNRGLLLVGDSFGMFMKRLLEAWGPADKKWGFHFDSNHMHHHSSPRKAMLDLLQDSAFDPTGLTDAWLVEVEHRVGFSDLSTAPATAKRKGKGRRKRDWRSLDRGQPFNIITFFEYNLFPNQLPPLLKDLNRGKRLSPDVPLRLTNGKPPARMTFMTKSDPGWRREPNKDWIRSTVADYKLLDSLCTARGLRFHAAHIPDRTTIYAEWILTDNRPALRAHYHAVQAAIDSAGISSLDALALFDAAHARGDTNLTLLHDRHWSFLGCSVVANEILKSLVSP